MKARIKPALAHGHHYRCKFRVAETCAIPIVCKHGFDVCPQCDPCTCSKGKKP